MDPSAWTQLQWTAAAITVQAVVRGYLIRCRLYDEWQAAGLIQHAARQRRASLDARAEASAWLRCGWDKLRLAVWRADARSIAWRGRLYWRSNQLPRAFGSWRDAAVRLREHGGFGGPRAARFPVRLPSSPSVSEVSEDVPSPWIEEEPWVGEEEDDPWRREEELEAWRREEEEAWMEGYEARLEEEPRRASSPSPRRAAKQTSRLSTPGTAPLRGPASAPERSSARSTAREPAMSPVRAASPRSGSPSRSSSIWLAAEGGAEGASVREQLDLARVGMQSVKLQQSRRALEEMAASILERHATERVCDGLPPLPPRSPHAVPSGAPRPRPASTGAHLRPTKCTAARAAAVAASSSSAGGSAAPRARSPFLCGQSTSPSHNAHRSPSPRLHSLAEPRRQPLSTSNSLTKSEPENASSGKPSGGGGGGAGGSGVRSCPRPLSPHLYRPRVSPSASAAPCGPRPAPISAPPAAACRRPTLLLAGGGGSARAVCAQAASSTAAQRPRRRSLSASAEAGWRPFSGPNSPPQAEAVPSQISPLTGHKSPAQSRTIRPQEPRKDWIRWNPANQNIRPSDSV